MTPRFPLLEVTIRHTFTDDIEAEVNILIRMSETKSYEFEPIQNLTSILMHH